MLLDISATAEVSRRGGTWSNRPSRPTRHSSSPSSHLLSRPGSAVSIETISIVSAQLTGCPVRFFDERYSTQAAERVLSAAGLIDYFDPIIISCEVGCNKPDPAIFNLALQTAAVDARNCIYIGDNYYDDALGSQKVGMPALIINRFGSLGTEEIKDCPIISDISEIFNFLA